MSLLQDVYEAAIDSKTDIADVLRKCRVLAARLQHPEFETWVKSELNGYDIDQQVPEYRLVRGIQSYGDFIGGWVHQQNVPLPTTAFPDEKWREAFTTKEIRYPVAEIHALLDSTPGPVLKMAWPPDLVYLMQNRFGANMALVQAYQGFAKAGMVGILDHVRNRILEFTLEIEKLDSSAGEIGGAKLDERKIDQVFNITIHGGSQNIAAGSHSVSQTVFVGHGDEEALRRAIAEIGGAAEDTEEVMRFVRAEPMGQAPELWSAALRGKIKRVGSALGTIGGKTAVSVLTKLICDYLGSR